MMRFFDKRKRGTEYRPPVRGVGIPTDRIVEVARALPADALCKRIRVLANQRMIVAEYFMPDNRQKSIRIEIGL